MDALNLLLHRSSQGRLESPAPEGEVLDNIMRAALRAPDHAALTPWRFIVCTGKGLVKLGQLFKKAAMATNMSESDIARAENLPLRAPMVIVAIADIKKNEKVPRVEQICSTACAVQAMQMAAVAQSYSGIWRTGSYATNTVVKKELGLKDVDEIVGFLYLGTPTISSPRRVEKDSTQFVEVWD